jgi:4'-phosphopantetheinyl transferase
VQLTPIADGEIHVWRIDLDQPAPGLLALLSPDEIERAGRLKQTLDRDRFIRTHGAMRSILGGYLGLSGDLLRFGVGDKGKPYLISPDTSLEFNLSHCQEMALLAVTKGIPVGIDLERISTKPLQLKIAKRMFPESVYAELSALPPEQLGKNFLRYWTEFEARVKCRGYGIFSNGEEHGSTQVTHFTPKPGWIACVALMQQDSGSLNLQHHNFGS